VEQEILRQHLHHKETLAAAAVHLLLDLLEIQIIPIWVVAVEVLEELEELHLVPVLQL
jgi:hypothetical protein